MKQRLLLILFFSFCSIALTQVTEQQRNKSITTEEIKAHIEFLASDKMMGRLPGTEQERITADYLKNEFISYGLKAFPNTDYLQDFKFNKGVDIDKNSSFEITLNDKKQTLELNKDFVVLPFSGTNDFAAEVVFVGYGISAPKLNWDDYEGIDVTDKFVIALRNNPEYDNPRSTFESQSSLRTKASIAQSKGAKGIIFINGPFPQLDEDKFPEIRYDRAPGNLNFSVVFAKRESIEKLFSNQGLTIETVQQKMKETMVPNSFLLKNTEIKIKTDVKEINATAINVFGYLEGNDPLLKNEFIVIGAHFDHLGMGDYGSLHRGPEKLIHNGADDNASGTSGILELAQKFSAMKNELKRSIIFIGFSAEELGLLGSDYFVKNPPIPVEQMVMMVNLDMIGRLNAENNLIVYGTGTSPEFKNILNEKNKFNFNLTFHDAGFGPSDHSSFYAKNIPVLFFFTGTHSDYHRPSDDFDKINFQGQQNILTYVFEVVNQINSNNEKPVYVNVPRKENERSGALRVYVGTIPDFSHQGEGFKISGVNEGSPAKKAGIQADDVIISFGERKVNNIYDYMAAMQNYVPGDVVEVIVKRNNEEVKLKLELAGR
ncbi:MAG: aminopeptidase [Chlorobiaceae bacterium]|nr:aminopeptidase [Chlorobiaceae bacterium]MBA4309709.1 aminopeptidase [Chlorobiaceae bacterium]